MSAFCLALKIKRNMYHINIDKELVRESIGDTIALLLSNISSKFDRVACNDVDMEYYNRDSVLPTNIPPSSLRDICVRQNKILISELSKYSVCGSYAEVRLFRYSAAVNVAQN